MGTRELLVQFTRWMGEKVEADPGNTERGEWTDAQRSASVVDEFLLTLGETPVRSDGVLLTSVAWEAAEADAVATLLKGEERPLEAKEVRGVVHSAMLRAAELARGEAREGVGGFSDDELKGTARDEEGGDDGAE